QSQRLARQQAAASFVKQFMTCPSGWLEFFARCSTKLLESNNTERNLLLKLAALGQRRRIFLGEKKYHSPPVFGLLRPTNHVLFLNEEQRIEFLRAIAIECGLDQLPQGAVVIRYRRRPGPALLSPKNFYEFATALPHQRASAETGRGSERMRHA